jgi:hypothetical protein
MIVDLLPENIWQNKSGLTLAELEGESAWNERHDV